MFQDLIPKKNNQQSGALDFSDLIPKKTLPQRAFEGARTLAGTLVQPIESTVRNVVAPPVAGIMSLAKDTSFQDEYAQYRNKLNLPENMSVTGLISGGTVQPTTRDILTQKGALQATGDVITALPIVKGAKIATGIAKTIAPLAGKATANIVAGAGLGYLTDVGMDLQEGQGVGEALTPGAGTAIGTAIPLAPYVIRTLGSVGKKVGEKVVGAVIPKSTKEAQILTTYKANKPFLERVTDVLKGESLPPQTASKTTVEKGLMGTKSMIGVQATRASNKLWKDVINPSLKASPEKVDLPKFFDTIRTRIITDNPDLGRQRVLLEALDAVKDDYKGISTIDMSQLQKFKEGWAKFVPEKAYRGKPIAGAYNDVRNQLADEARQTIYTTLGDDIKQAYFDYGNLKDLQEMGITSMTGQKLKGGAGSFMYELFSQSVTPIGTIAGRAIYKLANGMEIVGKAGARTLEEALELKPQVLTQPITQQPSQTIANQNKMFPIISNIDNTIPQSIENVEKVQEAVKLFNKRFGEEVLTPDDNFGIDLVKFYDRMQGASSKQKADITAELYKEILKGNKATAKTVLPQAKPQEVKSALGKLEKGELNYPPSSKFPTDEVLKKETKGKMSGFAQLLKETPEGKLKGKILPEDADAVVDFADLVNGDSKTSDATYLAMRKEIKKIANQYNIKGKTDRELVDRLTKKIYNDYEKFPGFADLGFLPKLALGTAVATGGLKAGLEYKKSQK